MLNGGRIKLELGETVILWLGEEQHLADKLNSLDFECVRVI